LLPPRASFSPLPFFLPIPRPQRSTLFPYTTLFRSVVVAAYNKYKDKGFTVLGVSLDRDKTSWTNAIAQDNLTWKHISDLQFWQRSEEHTSELQSRENLVCRLLLEKKKKKRHT